MARTEKNMDYIFWWSIYLYRVVNGAGFRGSSIIGHWKFLQNGTAEFKIIKSKMIQMLFVNARKQAELKLKVCEDIGYAKYKELTETLAELSNAKEFLAKPWASSYTDPKWSAKNVH
ncbi:Uncharacterized protein Fot_20310 [Forsythia ovata]|uniref:Uncharacterized protein n=1 Tax=Forsythia ovata TaxID=205694 RepID=A0ABD1VNI5_9LAMI